MPPNRVRSKRKVVPSRRAYENTLSRSTSRPAPSRTPKRRSRTPEQIDLTSNDPPDLEPKQQVGRKPSKPHEPLRTKYTMSTQVIVDKTLILTRLVLQTAGRRTTFLEMLLAFRQRLIVERLTSTACCSLTYAAISSRYNVGSRANWFTISYYSH